MKPASFDSTPEFALFTKQMKKLIAVPKARIDELVREAKESSTRKSNPLAPGRKKAIKKPSR